MGLEPGQVPHVQVIDHVPVRVDHHAVLAAPRVHAQHVEVGGALDRVPELAGGQGVLQKTPVLAAEVGEEHDAPVLPVAVERLQILEPVFPVREPVRVILQKLDKGLDVHVGQLEEQGRVALFHGHVRPGLRGQVGFAGAVHGGAGENGLTARLAFDKTAAHAGALENGRRAQRVRQNPDARLLQHFDQDDLEALGVDRARDTAAPVRRGRSGRHQAVQQLRGEPLENVPAVARHEAVADVGHQGGRGHAAQAAVAFQQQGLRPRLRRPVRRGTA